MKRLWKKPICWVVIYFISGQLHALSPGAVQQAVEAIPPEPVLPSVLPSLSSQAFKSPKTNHRMLTQREKRAFFAKLFKNPTFIALLNQRLKHPLYSNTPKAVYTPVGTPMIWGGIGLAVDTFSRYPSQTTGSGSTGFSAALPFGNSEDSIGGALAVGTSQLPSGPVTSFPNNSQRQQGTLSLSFSRWLGPNTIVTAGAANLMPWGHDFRAVGKTYYGAATQAFGLPLQGVKHLMSLSLGMGSGSFNPPNKLDSQGLPIAFRDSQVGFFANASFNISENLALVGDYYVKTFATGIAYNLRIFPVPFSLLLYAGNLKHTLLTPTTTYGLRIAMGVPFG